MIINSHMYIDVLQILGPCFFSWCSSSLDALNVCFLKISAAFSTIYQGRWLGLPLGREDTLWTSSLACLFFWLGGFHRTTAKLRDSTVFFSGLPPFSNSFWKTWTKGATKTQSLRNVNVSMSQNYKHLEKWFHIVPTKSNLFNGIWGPSFWDAAI